MDLGFKEIHVDALACDVMAARGMLVLRLVTNLSESGTKTVYIYCDYCITYSLLVAKWLGQLPVMHTIVGSKLELCIIFPFCSFCS